MNNEFFLTPAEIKKMSLKPRERIEIAVQSVRKNFLQSEIKQFRKWENIFSKNFVDVTNMMTLYPFSIPIARKRMKTEFKKIVSHLGRQAMNLTKQGIEASVAWGYTAGFTEMKFINPAMNFQITKKFGLIVNNARKFLNQYSPDGIVLSNRVWGHTNQLYNQVLKVINLGQIEGETHSKIIKKLRGILTFTKAEGRGIYKSAYRNYLRIVSTENARAFQEGYIRQVKTSKYNKYILGLQWNTSGDPCDDCISLSDVDIGLGAGVYSVDAYPQIPHPNCHCYPTTVWDEKKMYREEE